ncbi:hypothetical protein OC834_003970 [Tilletia horrida]|nr:hypothetical protein OC834_003970 [Tilletia horrida]
MVDFHPSLLLLADPFHHTFIRDVLTETPFASRVDPALSQSLEQYLEELRAAMRSLRNALSQHLRSTGSNAATARDLVGTVLPALRRCLAAFIEVASEGWELNIVEASAMHFNAEEKAYKVFDMKHKNCAFEAIMLILDNISPLLVQSIGAEMDAIEKLCGEDIDSTALHQAADGSTSAVQEVDEHTWLSHEDRIELFAALRRYRKLKMMVPGRNNPTSLRSQRSYEASGPDEFCRHAASTQTPAVPSQPKQRQQTLQHLEEIWHKEALHIMSRGPEQLCHAVELVSKAFCAASDHLHAAPNKSSESLLLRHLRCTKCDSLDYAVIDSKTVPIDSGADTIRRCCSKAGYSTVLRLLENVATTLPTNEKAATLLDGVRRCFAHGGESLLLDHALRPTRTIIQKGLRHTAESARAAAVRLCVVVVRQACASQVISARTEIVDAVHHVIEAALSPQSEDWLKMTSLVLACQLCKVEDIPVQQHGLALLTQTLSHKDIFGDLACDFLMQAQRHHEKTTFQLLQPHLKALIPPLIVRHAEDGEALTPLLKLLDQEMDTFLRTAMDETLPVLVAEANEAAVDLIAKTLRMSRAQLCLETAAPHIMAHILSKAPIERDRGLATFARMTADGQSGKEPSLEWLLRSSLTEVLGNLLIEYGDEKTMQRILTALTSALSTQELRLDALKSWNKFFSKLKFLDVAPVVGQTAAVMLDWWAQFSAPEKDVATQMLRYAILINSDALGGYIDSIPSLDALETEIPDIARKLRSSRMRQASEEVLSHILERVSSDNTSVSYHSLLDLLNFLQTNRPWIEALTSGNKFGAPISGIVSTVLAAASRMEDEHNGARNLCLQCLGVLGAIDPDRFDQSNEEQTRAILKDFNDKDEAVEFGIYLTQHVLVSAFRHAIDARAQDSYAWAIQEMLKYCGMSKAPGQGGPPSVIGRERWRAFPNSMMDTLDPLTSSRYVQPQQDWQEVPSPVYKNTTSYRKWLIQWARQLTAQVTKEEAKVFFDIVGDGITDQDILVARFILPHLVLHLLISASEDRRSEIRSEMIAVLNDQVDDESDVDEDRRQQSAQTVFHLLDHLNIFIRRKRLETIHKSSRKVRQPEASEALINVESILASIAPELMARASLRCKSYARALLSFESRVRIMKAEAGKTDGDMQEHYANMHEIYASVDEPDGMEGVSTRILKPTLEHQIREHEMTGRWTSAQSCWEVKLQQEPESLDSQIGLLRCLRSLGHFDNLRTHIRGILTRHPEWRNALAAFTLESSWSLGEWDDVAEAVEYVEDPLPEHGIGKAFLCMREDDSKGFVAAVQEARDLVGKPIFSAGSGGYPQIVDSVTQLHMLHELEMIQAIPKSAGQGSGQNAKLLASNGEVQHALREVETTLQSNKMYRLPGVDADTAGGTAANAIDLTDSPRAGGGSEPRKLSTVDVAKACLLRARLMELTGRFESNDVISRYKQSSKVDPKAEKSWYFLGRYYDSLRDAPLAIPMQHKGFVVRFFLKAAMSGTKYFYRTMPRIATIWLDAGEDPALIKASKLGRPIEKSSDTMDAYQKQELFQQMNERIRKAYPKVPAYQLVSRVIHKNEIVWQVLQDLVGSVVRSFPEQAMWSMVAGAQSKDEERSRRMVRILSRVKADAKRDGNDAVDTVVDRSRGLAEQLLGLCELSVKNATSLNLSHSIPGLGDRSFRGLLIPLQDSIVINLPTDFSSRADHQSFPNDSPRIRAFEERIEIMASLQKPRKIGIKGTDGRVYNFLCKPKDDLRKDARLMEFDSMINKFLQSNAESRRRRLHIRTYAVVTLNEECGFIEWVPNTVGFRNILTTLYASRGISLYTPDVKPLLDEARMSPDNRRSVETFETKLLTKYPPVFHEWFLATFSEPAAWMKARLSYARTAAVMSMVGWVLGLGDRHGENILFDANSGDTVHVDFNCLFEKGQTFEIPEKVPFRLTQNMVDALGVTGVEGVYRRACEITMSILRENKDSLMSVLDAMIHDPLVDFGSADDGKRKRHSTSANPDRPDPRVVAARQNLAPIERKLEGFMVSKLDTRPMSTSAAADHGFVSGTASSAASASGVMGPGGRYGGGGGKGASSGFPTNELVEMLIREATSSLLLSKMYVGWAPYL